MARHVSSDARFRALAHNPANRGYCILYREDATNYCPGCGRSHWYVGRTTAECGFCTTALPLQSAIAMGTGGLSRSHRPLAA